MYLFMAALWNRAGHYIFALWYLLSIFYLLFLSPNLSRRKLDVLPHMVWPWCEFWMQVWNVLRVWLAGNAGPKKWPSGHHGTTLSGYIFATKAHIDNRKKIVRKQCLPDVSSQYGELRPTSGWDLASLGHPCKF